MITDSGITGIQIPDGPSKNPIHQLQVLTPFRDALPNAIRVLKAKGITDIIERDRFGQTQLHFAAKNGHTETVRALIAAGANVDLANILKWTPLHLAAFNGHTDVVKVFINAGAAANLTLLIWDQESPLNLAIKQGHKEIVKLFK